jgi:CDP-diglyceride synthetase
MKKWLNEIAGGILALAAAAFLYAWNGIKNRRDIESTKKKKWYIVFAVLAAILAAVAFGWDKITAYVKTHFHKK